MLVIWLCQSYAQSVVHILPLNQIANDDDSIHNPPDESSGFLQEPGLLRRGEPLYQRMLSIGLPSLGMKHLPMHQIAASYVLAGCYMNGDMDAPLWLFAQREQESNDEKEGSPA